MGLLLCFTNIVFLFLSLKVYLWWSFMYLVFTCMPGDSYRRRLGSLLSYLRYVFRALITSLVCCFCLVLNKAYSYPGIRNSTNNNKYRKHKSDLIMSVLLCCSMRRQTPHGIGCMLQKSSSQFWTSTQLNQQQQMQQRDTASRVNPLDKTTE